MPKYFIKKYSFAFQISFGFDINYQLIDASLTTTESNSTTPTQDIINRGENIKENALTETGMVDKLIWNIGGYYERGKVSSI